MNLAMIEAELVEVILKCGDYIKKKRGGRWGEEEHPDLIHHVRR
jgi:hypothetical protein